MVATYDVVQQCSEGSCGSTALHYDCFATFYEHALQRVFEELALFGGTLSHIMLANSHCAKKNKLPLQNEQTTSSHEQAFIAIEHGP